MTASKSADLGSLKIPTAQFTELMHSKDKLKSKLSATKLSQPRPSKISNQSFSRFSISLTPNYIMKMQITSTSRRSFRERMIPNGFNLFVESNATTLVDKFFNDNKIYELRFKCKTWGKVMRMATKLNIAAMRKFFKDEPCDISFSHYAGCSMCPCSPGYRVRKAFAEPFRQYANNHVWAKIEVDVSSIEKILPKMVEALQAEIAANSK